MSRSKKSTRRNFEAEAAEQVERIVKANPNRQWQELYQIATEASQDVLDWIESHLEDVRRKAFCSLMRYSTATTKSGEKVRLLQSYTKFVQTEDGKEKQLKLWCHLDVMSRAVFELSVLDQDRNINGCVAARNAAVTYWNEKHPDEEPLQLRFDFSTRKDATNPNP